MRLFPFEPQWLLTVRKQRKQESHVIVVNQWIYVNWFFYLRPGCSTNSKTVVSFIFDLNQTEQQRRLWLWLWIVIVTGFNRNRRDSDDRLWIQDQEEERVIEPFVHDSAPVFVKRYSADPGSSRCAPFRNFRLSAAAEMASKLISTFFTFFSHWRKSTIE